jgi:hypothetical protein
LLLNLIFNFCRTETVLFGKPVEITNKPVGFTCKPTGFLPPKIVRQRIP